MSTRLVDQDLDEVVSVHWSGISANGKAADKPVARRMTLRDAMVLVSVVLDPVLQTSVIIHGQTGNW